MSPRRPAPPNDLALDDLHPASNGLGRERVSEIQRARMLSAMVEMTAEHGAGNVTVAHVVARSGVSRRTFYEIFEDREGCFLAAFDNAIEKITTLVVPSYEKEGRWQEKIRAGLTTLLEFLDYERGTGRLAIVETLGAGPRALERRQRVLAQIITSIDQGRTEGKHSDGPPPLTAEGVVGAVLSVLHARLLACLPPATGGPRMGELVNPLMAIIVLPYLGAAAARRELQRAVPKPSDMSRRSASADPLRELDMRLTYRTVRVLMAVAANPGSSNRAVADGSDITDQGQISKLLARLHGLGLVENTGAGSTRGEPNAWRLTEKGKEVHRAIAETTHT
jgi:AcrR family transcriptional regulator/DNA-binding MarR family transcriptional regulator